MAFLEERVVAAGINFDDEPRSIEQGDYLAPTRNIRIYSTDGSQFGVVTNIKGNAQVIFNLPAGNNFSNGAREDRETGNIYIFIYNDQLNHSIFRYVPNSTGGVVQLVIQDSILGFQKHKRINHANLVDGKLLYWSDADSYPKKINVEKALENKKRQYKVYFGTSCSTVNNYTFSVFNPDGSLNSSHTFVGMSGQDSFELAHNIATSAHPLPISMSNNGDAIDVEINLVGEYTITVTNAPSSNQVIAIAYNFYPKPYQQDFIDRLKYPRKAEPTAVFMYDPSVKTNRVKDRVFQFSVAYIYDDNEQSTWSPLSTIAAFNSECTSIPQSAYNFIRIDFTEDRLNNPAIRSMIKYVALAFKEHNDGKPKLIAYLEPSEFGIGSNTFDFYNNGIYKGIADDEWNTLFSFVPHRCGGQEFIGNRIVDGDVTEGYDNVAIDANVDVKYTNKTVGNAFNIAGKFLIENFFSGRFQPIYYQVQQPPPSPPLVLPCYGGIRNLPAHAPDAFMASLKKQGLFLDGLTVYLSGTNHYAQTKQKVTTTDATIQNPASGVYFIGMTPSETFSASQYKRNHVFAQQQTGNLFSEFTIEGVRPGIYIMRVASNMITSDDLADNKRYQFTSIPTKKIAGVLHTECVIEIVDDGNGFYHINNLSNGNVYVGTPTVDAQVEDTIIYDLATDSASGDTLTVSGYIKDGADATLPTVVKGAIIEKGVELAKVRLSSQNPAGNVFVTTDHNGFFYRTEIDLGGTLSWTSTAICSSTQNAGNSDVHTYNAFSTVPYAVTTVTNNTGGTHLSVFIRHKSNPLDSISKFCRTYITGNVSDGNGTPIPGIPVNITNAQHSFTDGSGNFKILIYGDSGNACARSENLIFSVESAACTFSFVNNNTSFSVQIGQTVTTPPPYDFFNWFSLGNFVGTFLSFSTNTAFKKGFDGEFGLIYYDRGNRSGTVNADEKTRVHINFYTEKDIVTNTLLPGGIPELRWTIRHKPPEWATHYQWCRTKNLQVSWYLQWVGNIVQYVDDVPLTQTSSPTVVAFNNASAKYVRVELSNFVTYQGKYKNSQIGYSWQKGDRIRLISNYGTLFPDYYDYEIEQYNSDSSGNFIYFKVDPNLGIDISNTNSLTGHDSAVLFEIYVPNPSTSEKIFYEFGETFRILDNGNGKFHEGQSTNQDPLNPFSSPATGVFRSGDAYYRTRVIPYLNSANAAVGISLTVDDQSVSDFYASRDQSIGRINVENKSSVQIRREKVFRYSEKYIQDTKINGLSWFSSENQAQIEKGDGAITKLQVAGRVLLAIQPSSVNSLYINEKEFRDTSSSSSIIKSDSFIGSINPLKLLSGTINPESVKEYEGRVWYYDQLKGMSVRYADDGLVPISRYKAVSYFTNKSKELLAVGSSEIYALGFIDPKNMEYGIAFRDLGQSTPRIKEETIVFNEPTNRWICFYDYYPEQFCFSGMETLSIKDGQLWAHERSNVYNNFYGVQYPSVFTVVSNENSGKIRSFIGLSQESTKVWGLPNDGDVSIPPSDKYPNGMASRLLKTKFRNVYGVWYSPFMKDINSPNMTMPNALVNGRDLAGHVVKLTLQNDDTELVQLKAVNIRYILIEFSKK